MVLGKRFFKCDRGVLTNYRLLMEAVGNGVFAGTGVSRSTLGGPPSKSVRKTSPCSNTVKAELGCDWGGGKGHVSGEKGYCLDSDEKREFP